MTIATVPSQLHPDLESLLPGHQATGAERGLIEELRRVLAANPAVTAADIEILMIRSEIGTLKGATVISVIVKQIEQAIADGTIGRDPLSDIDRHFLRARMGIADDAVEALRDLMHLVKDRGFEHAAMLKALADVGLPDGVEKPWTAEDLGNVTSALALAAVSIEDIDEGDAEPHPPSFVMGAAGMPDATDPWNEPPPEVVIPEVVPDGVGASIPSAAPGVKDATVLLGCLADGREFMKDGALYKRLAPSKKEPGKIDCKLLNGKRGRGDVLALSSGIAVELVPIDAPTAPITEPAPKPDVTPASGPTIGDPFADAPPVPVAIGPKADTTKPDPIAPVVHVLPVSEVGALADAISMPRQNVTLEARQAVELLIAEGWDAGDFSAALTYYAQVEARRRLQARAQKAVQA